MNINLQHIRIEDLFKGYVDNGNSGVIGYGGNLDIRPAYQREFVYEEKERNAVIDTVTNGYPLNVMYWVDVGNGKYEILDGQQRTISICQYVNGDFSINGMAYHNLPPNKKKEIDDYELMVYFCIGTPSEKLEWFRVINTAGVKLNEQELRNSCYTGLWLTDAKLHFSKINCVAQQKGSKYLDGSAKRQDYLQTALKWKSHDEGISILDCMSKYQKNCIDSNELWQYFDDVINWVIKIFSTYRPQIKGIEWGILYNKYKNLKLNSNEVEKKVQSLMIDDEVDNKKGIYEFVLSGNEKHLNLRAFSDKDKAQAFANQVVSGTGKATCPKCNDNAKLFDLNKMEADHIVPWSKGGKTTLSNCQMLCSYHNGVKSNN
jgi:hypothetical protein